MKALSLLIPIMDVERVLNSSTTSLRQFYNDIFFPALDKEGIKHIVHMGDVFDSRRGIEFKSLKWAKE